MPTRANPNVAAGSEPTTRNRATVVQFVGAPTVPSGRTKAKVSGRVSRPMNSAGQWSRRAPQRPHSA